MQAYCSFTYVVVVIIATLLFRNSECSTSPWFVDSLAFCSPDTQKCYANFTVTEHPTFNIDMQATRFLMLALKYSQGSLIYFTSQCSTLAT